MNPQFIQIVLFEGALVALDKDGGVWTYSNQNFKWYELPTDRVRYPYPETVNSETVKADPKSNKCAHTEHCCSVCGCKYGEEDCPVFLKEKKQSHPHGKVGICGGW